MSKKRGLSLEEKRDRLLEVFLDSCEVYVWKEVEKLAMKKGITPQSVKDVLQSLVDDDLVHQEKIGAANYFWAFPSEASTSLENEITKAREKLNTLQEKVKTVSMDIQNTGQGREDSELRKEKTKELSELTTQVDGLKVELAKYSENDPEMLERLKMAVDESRASANRWLDNLFALQSWCRKRFAGMENELKKFFSQNGVHDDVDYLP